MAERTDILYKIIGERIKEIRIRISVSQEKLADSVSVGRTSISNIELGRHKAPLHIIYDIAKSLEVDIHFIIPHESEINSRIIEDKEKDKTVISNLLDKKKELTKSDKKKIEDIINKLGHDI